jgi:hypothetical protein
VRLLRHSLSLWPHTLVPSPIRNGGVATLSSGGLGPAVFGSSANLGTVTVSGTASARTSRPRRFGEKPPAARFASYETKRSGRGEPPLRPEVSAFSKPRAAPIQVGVTTPTPCLRSRYAWTRLPAEQVWRQPGPRRTLHDTRIRPRPSNVGWTAPANWIARRDRYGSNQRHCQPSAAGMARSGSVGSGQYKNISCLHPQGQLRIASLCV